MSNNTIEVFPFVTFTNLDGKTFCIPRERIIHVETYQQGQDELDQDKTYVRFISPDPKSRGPLHAVVDMPLEIFRDEKLKVAWQEMSNI